MSGKCQIILWDREQRVSGFVIETDRSGVMHTALTVTAADSGTFIEQLAEVNRQLKEHKADVVVAGGAMPNAYWLELTLPPTPLHELGSALEFELPRQIPRPLDEVVWFYRLLENRNQRSRVRVFVCAVTAWQDTLAALREAGVQFDAYCHAFTAVEPKHDEQNLHLPSHQPGFVWRQALGDPVALREYQVTDADVPVTEAPELLIAEYALSERFQRDKRYLSDHPAAMRPQRLRGLKFAVITLTVIAIAALGTLWYRYRDDRQARENAIAQEQEDIEYAMIAQQEGMDRLIEVGESAQKLLEAVDEIDPLAVMAVLSEKLPAHAWVTSFRCSDNKVALSLLIKGETDSIVEVLNKEIRPLIVENLRQQLNNDGSATITVTLQKSAEAPE